MLTQMFLNSRRADIMSGECRIGLRLPANIPLLAFDICINVCAHDHFGTGLEMILETDMHIQLGLPYCAVPTTIEAYVNSQSTIDSVNLLMKFSEMYSYNGTKGRLRTMARRTFIGSACTLLSTVAYANIKTYILFQTKKLIFFRNLTALLILKGREPGWVSVASLRRSRIIR